MTPVCRHEDAIVAAAVEGRALSTELVTHLDACASCREVQALVGVLREDRDEALAGSHMPSAAVVWWRAERRARAEAAAAAARPITVATGLAVASAIGVLVSLAGALAWWWSDRLASLTVLGDATRLVSVDLAAVPSGLRVALWLVAGVLLLAMPVAWYVATRDDA